MTFQEFIAKLQAELNKKGEHLDEDGAPGPLTSTALAKYDVGFSLTLKPEAPPKIPIESGSAFSRAKLALIAEEFCAHNYPRTAPEIMAVKEPFAGPPCSFGRGAWPHCAATVRFLSVKAGLNMPVLCPTGYSFAFVPAVHTWAKSMGFFLKNDGTNSPEAGDWVFYDWDQDHMDDHIGVHLRMNGKYYVAAEGNVDDGKTGIKSRVSGNILGWARIPDGFKF